MKSVRSSRRHGKRRGQFVFEVRQRLCGLCLVEKIVPEHCTTILKATLQKICAWPWKCLISFPDLLWTKPKARSGKVRKFVFLDWLLHLTPVQSPL